MFLSISHISTIIFLSCESYTNKGATFEMFKEAIESIPDPGNDRLNLSCVKSGINNNVGFRTTLGYSDENRSLIAELIVMIEDNLEEKMKAAKLI